MVSAELLNLNWNDCQHEWCTKYGQLSLSDSGRLSVLFHLPNRQQLTGQIYTVNQFVETADREK